MKYYMLQAIVGGRDVKLKRSYFTSRDEAIEYMFKYYNDHYMYGLEVNDEHIVDGDKHYIEYVCNYQNRFKVKRYTTT